MKGCNLDLQGFTIQDLCSYRFSLETLASLLKAEVVYVDNLPVDGVTFLSPSGVYLIVVNGSSSYVRQRYTLAHEIAHLILNHKMGFFSFNTKQERQANRLAAEILMPEENFIQEVNKGRTVAELCRIFQVSKQAVIVRIGDLEKQGKIKWCKLSK